jgi:hypothetical protein
MPCEDRTIQKRRFQSVRHFRTLTSGMVRYSIIEAEDAETTLRE